MASNSHSSDASHAPGSATIPASTAAGETPGQLTPAPPRARPPSTAGRIVVIVMFIIAAAMGAVARWYWTTQVKLADTTQSDKQAGLSEGPDPDLQKGPASQDADQHGPASRTDTTP